MRRCTRCKLNRNYGRYVGKRGRICDVCRKGSASEAARNRRLKEVYFLEPEEWARILELTDNKCGGCHQARHYRMQVDHDHKVEREMRALGWSERDAMRASIRGPACRRCNKLLRDCRDSIANLQGLIDFLESPPARKVLT